MALARSHADRGFDRGLVLAVALPLSAPMLELLFGVGGSDLFGARNLNVAWVGLALTIAGVCVAAPIWGSIALVAVLACFTVGTIRARDEQSQLADTKQAAAIVDERAASGEVLLDLYTSPLVNPVPRSALSAHASDGAAVVSPFLPASPPPFLLTPSQSEIDRKVKDVWSSSAGENVYVLGSPGRVMADRGSVSVNVDPPSLSHQPLRPIDVAAPAGSRIIDTNRCPGSTNSS